MKVITLNCGSSSVKYGLLDMPSGIRRASGIVERVTQDGSFIRHSKLGDEESIQYHPCPTHAIAIGLVPDFLTNPPIGVIKALSEIGAVGHPVVHGGEKYTKSVLINEQVIEDIEAYSELAPLHNPANIAGIRAAMKLMPNIPHVAVFDTQNQRLSGLEEENWR